MGKLLEFVPNNKEPVTYSEPAKIIEFGQTCKGCRNLVEVDEGTYICSSRVRINDEPIVPVVNDEYTSDWGFCGGEFYERRYDRASCQNRSRWDDNR